MSLSRQRHGAQKKKEGKKKGAYAVDDRVVLKGLSKEPKYNGVSGIIRSKEGQTWRVELFDKSHGTRKEFRLKEDFLIPEHEYEANNEAEENLATMDWQHWQIPLSKLTYDDGKPSMLGAGAFGNVYRGIMEPTDEGRAQARRSVGDEDVDSCAKIKAHVAVKRQTKGSKEEFLREARTMIELEHENLVKIYGVCTLETPILIIEELCEHGSLKDYLPSLRPFGLPLDGYMPPPQLSFEDLAEFIKQITEGMVYMSCNGFVHRDLAARNVLVEDCGSRGLRCKVSDFGLTAELKKLASVDPGKRVPAAYRWSAPETMAKKQRFSHASDAWAWAITVYEIVTFGDKDPYSGMSQQDVMDNVCNDSSYRLKWPIQPKAPHGCPSALYDIMFECWKCNPDDRPNFEKIREQLKEVPGFTFRDGGVEYDPEKEEYWGFGDSDELSPFQQNSELFKYGGEFIYKELAKMGFNTYARNSEEVYGFEGAESAAAAVYYGFGDAGGAAEYYGFGDAGGAADIVGLSPDSEPGKSLATALVPVSIGCTVIIDGLQSKPELNGTVGVVKERRGDRWVVSCSEGAAVLALKPVNITPREENSDSTKQRHDRERMYRKAEIYASEVLNENALLETDIAKRSPKQNDACLNEAIKAMHQHRKDYDDIYERWWQDDLGNAWIKLLKVDHDEYEAKAKADKTMQKTPTQPNPWKDQFPDTTKFGYFINVLEVFQDTTSDTSPNVIVERVCKEILARRGMEGVGRFELGPCKKTKRVCEKVLMKDGKFDMVRDYGRGYIIINKGYERKMLQLTMRLHDHDEVDVVRAKNRFDRDYHAGSSAGYRDCQLILKLVKQNGWLFELQIIPQEMYELKNAKGSGGGHEDYTKYRFILEAAKRNPKIGFADTRRKAYLEVRVSPELQADDASEGEDSEDFV